MVIWFPEVKQKTIEMPLWHFDSLSLNKVFRDAHVNFLLGEDFVIYDDCSYKIIAFNRLLDTATVTIEYYLRGIPLGYEKAKAKWGTAEEIEQKKAEERAMYQENKEMV